jgi:hypothetical protein
MENAEAEKNGFTPTPLRKGLPEKLATKGRFLFQVD